MILVAGATGILGSEIVRLLRERDSDVRALARKTSAPGKVEALRKMGAEIVTGDLKDRASLDAACRGTEAVVSTVSTIVTAQPGDSFAETDDGGTKQLVDAAAAAGVRHFVYVSFDTERMPDSPLTSAKRDVEEHVRRSGMTYSILRPSLFMESWLGPMLFGDPAAGTAKVYGKGTQPIRYVAVADVAELAVQSLTVPEARNATIPFGGREALSQRDAVRVFEDVYDKPFAVTEIPEQALEAQWYAAEDPFQKTFSALMLGVARGFDSGIEPPFDSFPMKMTSVREFVRRSAPA